MLVSENFKKVRKSWSRIIVQERVGYLEEYYKEPDLYHIIELKYMSMVTGEDMQINSGS